MARFSNKILFSLGALIFTGGAWVRILLLGPKLLSARHSRVRILLGGPKSRILDFRLGLRSTVHTRLVFNNYLLCVGLSLKSEQKTDKCSVAYLHLTNFDQVVVLSECYDIDLSILSSCFQCNLPAGK